MDFIGRFVMRKKPWPKEFTDTFETLAEDNTVYSTMYAIFLMLSLPTNPVENLREGPSEFTISGSLRDYDVTSILHTIKVPTLVFNGRYDEVQDFVVLPLFQHIPHVKWYTFAESAHMTRLEEPEKWIALVSAFVLN